MKLNKKMILGIVFSLVGWCSLSAQSYMEKAEVFEKDSLHYLVRNGLLTVKWTGPEDRYCYYSEKLENGDQAVYMVDTRKWKKSLVFRNSELTHLFEETLPEGEKHSKINLNLYNLEFDPEDIGRFYVEQGKHCYCYQWQKQILSSAEDRHAEKPVLPSGRNSSFSSDSLFQMVVRDNDLYLYEGDRLFCLAEDGGEDHSYGLRGTGPSKSEKEYRARGMWIGDTHHFIGHRKDERNVETLSLVDVLADRPRVRTYKFPMPGDTAVFRYDFYYVDADQKTLRRLDDLQKYPDQVPILPRFSDYQHSGPYVYLAASNRQRDTLELFRVDGRTGEVANLITEACPPHFNEMLFSYHVLNDGKDILWWSERSGKGRFYHYDQDGNLLNPVMERDFVSGQIVSIDTLARTFIFEGFGGEKGIHPDYRFFYKASVDHRFEPVLLTPGNGDHCIEFSPDRKWIVDTYSRMDLAPVYQICDMKGKVRMPLGQADVSALEAKGWRYPEVVEFVAADSLTPLYGVVYLPFEIEEGKKYPVIADVYPGPQTDLVPRGFSLDDNYNHSLAQLGFIVVNASYRGSNPNRGRDFYNHGYGNLRDYALEDNYAVLRQVAQKYPFADLERVGIYGHSGGGFMALTAMLTRPDFYKVCVSASGNHDNNIYTQWWGESFHGVRRVEGEGGRPAFECQIPTNLDLAPNLQGRLLLVTGDMDNNVHPASTLRMADALIKAGKRFDMLVIPGADHGLGSPAYFTNAIRYYFVEHLLGLPQKDINIINHN